jgi:subtilisin family serine protease
MQMIDDAYIQWPHIYMSTAVRKKRVVETTMAGAKKPKVTPPKVPFFNLRVPDDVTTRLRVDAIHKKGGTGKGVRVVMVDSGFAHQAHPFFAARGYKSSVALAPHAFNDKTDPNGHGTGESTNIFSIAPGATFIGVKVDDDNDPQGGASLLEGFQTALKQKPNVISVSMGFDLRDQQTGRQLVVLPSSLAALEAEVIDAVAQGIMVVFSAGNGHFSFPGMMPDVLSAGGVFVDKNDELQASDYASAFDSKIYSGRHVPDCCGLVGLQPHAAYIMLPVPPGCEIDRECSADGDKTTPNDGWGVFSGTSAAAPQLAGICALLLEKNPGLAPAEIKAVLERTARDVLVGNSNASSSDTNTPLVASAGDDGATGSGLVDAFAAWQQV